MSVIIGADAAGLKPKIVKRIFGGLEGFQVVDVTEEGTLWM